MFTITNTRIVGLIAVVCAFVVAPQALAESSTHSRIAPPGDEPRGFDVSDFSGPVAFTAATPDAVQGNGLSGFDLGDLKNGRVAITAATPDAAQGNDLSGFDLNDLNNIPGYQQQQEYLKGLALAALTGSTPKSVQVQPASQWRSPIGQPANNRPGGIVRASKTGTAAMFVYKTTNPGWGAAATAAKKSAAKPAPQPAATTEPVACLGQAEYEYVYAGCEWWS